MKRSLIQYEAILFFKGYSSIKDYINEALRKEKRLALTKKELEFFNKQLYSKFLEKFVKEEVEKKISNKKYAFSLTKERINNNIKKLVKTIELNSARVEQKSISRSELIKNKYKEIKKKIGDPY